MSDISPFVATQYLSAHLNDNHVRVVDASWFLPNSDHDAEQEFESEHIPGAVYFDLDLIADRTSDLPHMVAAPDKFAAQVGALGLSETDTIVVYDSAGLFSSARVWWNFKIMGAENCFVLDGGLPKWCSEKHPIETGPANPQPGNFNVRPKQDAVVGLAEMVSIVNSAQDDGLVQIVDLRPAPRFCGTQPEPRPGLRSGKMPSSFNLPFLDLINDGRMIEKNDILIALSKAGIDPKMPIITSCGSGVTAPLLNLALAKIGAENARVYDGSWAEWGAQAELPVIGADGENI